MNIPITNILKFVCGILRGKKDIEHTLNNAIQFVFNDCLLIIGSNYSRNMTNFLTSKNDRLTHFI